MSEPAQRPVADYSELRRQMDAALQASMDRCARCKACDNQTDAVMEVVVKVLHEEREQLAKLVGQQRELRSSSWYADLIREAGG